jgi:hypothetical protein
MFLQFVCVNCWGSFTQRYFISFDFQVKRNNALFPIEQMLVQMRMSYQQLVRHENTEEIRQENIPKCFLFWSFLNSQRQELTDTRILLRCINLFHDAPGGSHQPCEPTLLPMMSNNSKTNRENIFMEKLTSVKMTGVLVVCRYLEVAISKGCWRLLMPG